MGHKLEQKTARERLEQAKLYGITLPPQGQTYEKAVEAACKGGADIIQLRDKDLSPKKLVKLGLKLKAVCGYYETLFIVNDRLDIALACGADGVHLGQDDLSLKEARDIAQAYAKSAFLIGCSTHSLQQALEAQEDGADYIGCGPIFETPTKSGYKPVGLDLIKKYKEAVQIPFVAIGGVDETNVESVVKAGAQCVAVVRAVFGKPDVESAARSLKSKIR